MRKSVMILLSVLLLVSCGKKTNLDLESKLFLSVCSGNLEAVKESVKNGADINTFSHYHDRTDNNQKITSPLLVAATNGNYSIVRYLISEGSDVNCTDTKGRSLLQYCAEFYPQIIEDVLVSGADVNYRDKEGYTAIDYAVMDSRKMTCKTTFESLIEYGAVPTSVTVELLLNDLDTDEYEMLKTSLQYVADCNVSSSIRNAFSGKTVDSYNQTEEKTVLGGIAAFGKWNFLQRHLSKDNEDILSFLLKVATYYGNFDVVKGLTENFNIKLASEAGDNDVLYYAVQNSDTAITEYVLDNYDGDMSGAAVNAIKYNNINALNLLMENGLNPEAKFLGFSLLYHSCFYNNKEALLLLLKSGAAPDIDSLGCACKYGYTELAEILIQNGANVNEIVVYDDGSMATPPMWKAVGSGNIECVKLLCENGFDFEYIYDNNNVVEYAELHNSVNIIKYLKDSN